MEKPSSEPLNRRGFLGRAAIAGATSAFAVSSATPRAHADHHSKKPNHGLPDFKYCLNTSTIRGKKIPIAKELGMIARAGYDSIEPWISEIQKHKEQGGSLKDLGKQIADLGLTVESAIGFANWISDDKATRKKGLENAKRDMDLLAAIGGKRIAAPPAGASGNNSPKLNLSAAAERYAALLDAGKNSGIVPQLELWGFSKNLSKLGEVAYVAIESGHPDACVLTDVYHIYKGGSDFEGLKFFAGKSLTVLHMNDYPSDPPRETIGDGDRVFPGDGIAPISKILRTMHSNGFSGVLSLELFNRTYWEQDAELVLKNGFQKMKAEVTKAFS